MPYILYTTGTATTGRQLKEILNIQGGITPPEGQADWLIRWGASTRVARRPQHVLNSRGGILRAIDKSTALQTFSDRGVPAPTIVPLTNDGIRATQYPALARARNHVRGQDIILCLQRSDAHRAREAGREFLVQYVPTQREYRIHVFDGTIIKTSQKVLTHPADALPWMRNHQHGYTFRQQRTAPGHAAEVAAIGAVRALGLIFGAVDIIVADDGRVYVLEVNTGPGLVPHGLRTYATQFAERVGLQELNFTVVDAMEETEEEEFDG